MHASRLLQQIKSEERQPCVVKSVRGGVKRQIGSVLGFDWSCLPFMSWTQERGYRGKNDSAQMMWLNARFVVYNIKSVQGFI